MDSECPNCGYPLQPEDLEEDEGPIVLTPPDLSKIPEGYERTMAEVSYRVAVALRDSLLKSYEESYKILGAWMDQTGKDLEDGQEQESL